MACRAARKAVAALLRDGQWHSAQDVWSRIRWWTPDTIIEALDELASAEAIRVHHRNALGKPLYSALDRTARLG